MTLIRDAQLSLNDNAIAEYFKYDAILGGNTFYKEISRLPNASALVISNDKDTLHEYWTPSVVMSRGQLSEKTYQELSIGTFESIADEYVTQGKTCLSLTGGWDTRTILSILHNKKISVPCYTFGESKKDSYDVRIARRLVTEPATRFTRSRSATPSPITSITGEQGHICLRRHVAYIEFL